ncbi:MAG: hypothetical protein ACTS5A_02835, partial [Candidatus Hodgkinia cicadicola]
MLARGASIGGFWPRWSGTEVKVKREGVSNGRWTRNRERRRAVGLESKASSLCWRTLSSQVRPGLVPNVKWAALWGVKLKLNIAWDAFERKSV